MPRDEPLLDGLGAANLPWDGGQERGPGVSERSRAAGHPAARAGFASLACIPPINHIIKNSSNMNEKNQHIPWVWFSTSTTASHTGAHREQLLLSPRSLQQDALRTPSLAVLPHFCHLR